MIDTISPNFRTTPAAPLAGRHALLHLRPNAAGHPGTSKPSHLDRASAVAAKGRWRILTSRNTRKRPTNATAYVGGGLKVDATQDRRPSTERGHAVVSGGLS